MTRAIATQQVCGAVADTRRSRARYLVPSMVFPGHSVGGHLDRWRAGGNPGAEPPLDSRTSFWSTDHLPCLYVFPGKLGYVLRHRKNASEPWGNLSHGV
jgi:hypothetical protein